MTKNKKLATAQLKLCPLKAALSPSRPSPPPCFTRWSRKNLFFLGKRKPSMGLSFQWDRRVIGNVLLLKAFFAWGIANKLKLRAWSRFKSKKRIAAGKGLQYSRTAVGNAFIDCEQDEEK